VLGGIAGAVPVILRVFGSSTVAGSTYCRLQTSDSSWVEVTLSTSLGWAEAFGWLDVSVSPETDPLGQLFIRGTGVASLYGMTLELLP
jgi:hypothetical protein